jgi:DNA-directed RNA polymerase, omega subunit
LEGDKNMLHPSYTDLMRIVNSEVEPGEQPVVNSRYSIVIATARRARQIIDGSMPLVNVTYPKPLSIAVEELYRSKVKIVGDDETIEQEEQKENTNPTTEA